MLFTEDITVLADTPKASPKEEIIGVAKGIITWISVLFPPGCNGMVDCVVLHHEHQIAPSTEGMTMIGNGFPVEWTEFYESYQPPFQLKVKLWSPGTTYNHTITVRVAVLPRKAIIALAIVDTLKSVFELFFPKRIFTGPEEEGEAS